jgi:hypothetical protein
MPGTSPWGIQPLGAEVGATGNHGIMYMGISFRNTLTNGSDTSVKSAPVNGSYANGVYTNGGFANGGSTPPTVPAPLESWPPDNWAHVTGTQETRSPPELQPVSWVSEPGTRDSGLPVAASPVPADMRGPDARPLTTRLTDVRAAAPRELPDVRMDQIRDLLFGEQQRQSEARIAGLEARVRELENALHHRLDAMQARIDAVAVENRGDRRTTLDELARGMSDLGDRIKRLHRD